MKGEREGRFEIGAQRGAAALSLGFLVGLSPKIERELTGSGWDPPLVAGREQAMGPPRTPLHRRAAFVEPGGARAPGRAMGAVSATLEALGLSN